MPSSRQRALYGGKAKRSNKRISHRGQIIVDQHGQHKAVAPGASQPKLAPRSERRKQAREEEKAAKKRGRRLESLGGQVEELKDEVTNVPQRVSDEEWDD